MILPSDPGLVDTTIHWSRVTIILNTHSLSPPAPALLKLWYWDMIWLVTRDCSATRQLITGDTGHDQQRQEAETETNLIITGACLGADHEVVHLAIGINNCTNIRQQLHQEYFCHHTHSGWIAVLIASLFCTANLQLRLNAPNNFWCQKLCVWRGQSYCIIEHWALSQGSQQCIEMSGLSFCWIWNNNNRDKTLQ